MPVEEKQAKSEKKIKMIEKTLKLGNEIDDTDKIVLSDKLKHNDKDFQYFISYANSII